MTLSLQATRPSFLVAAQSLVSASDPLPNRHRRQRAARRHVEHAASDEVISGNRETAEIGAPGGGRGGLDIGRAESRMTGRISAVSPRLDHLPANADGRVSWEAAAASPYPKSQFPDLRAQTLSGTVGRLNLPCTSCAGPTYGSTRSHLDRAMPPPVFFGLLLLVVAAVQHHKCIRSDPLRLWLTANVGPCKAHVHPPCSC
jgi:hypothetical protein